MSIAENKAFLPAIRIRSFRYSRSRVCSTMRCLLRQYSISFFQIRFPLIFSISPQIRKLWSFSIGDVNVTNRSFIGISPQAQCRLNLEYCVWGGQLQVDKIISYGKIRKDRSCLMTRFEPTLLPIMWMPKYSLCIQGCTLFIFVFRKPAPPLLPTRAISYLDIFSEHFNANQPGNYSKFAQVNTKIRKRAP